MRWVVPIINPAERPVTSIAIVPMRRPSVVLVPEYVRRLSIPPEQSTGLPGDNEDSESDDATGESMTRSTTRRRPSIDASFTAALTSAICTAAAATTEMTSTKPALTTPTSTPTPDMHSTTTEDRASTATQDDQHAEGGDEAEIGEYRRKVTVLVCSIGLVITFNFVFILLLFVDHLNRQHQVICSKVWSALAGLLDSRLAGLAPIDTIGARSTESLAAFPADDRSACAFAVFALVCNSYHLGLLFLFHRTKRLYLVAALFLIYIDVGICGACLYFGVVCEFYMWLAAVVAMAYYIFGRHISRVFLVAVLLEGLLLYPCNIYMIQPVAPLYLDSPVQLAATCTMIMCVGVISHIHEASRQATLDRLRESNEKLRRSTESKTLFLSAITHELRTPLTGIIGMADELLLDEQEKEEQSQPGSPDQDDQCHQRVYRHRVQTEEERMEAVRIIVTCARHLLGLVNDVLDFEKIESRQLDLEAIPFDVEKEADLVTSMLAFPAASTRVRIEKHMRLAHGTRVGDPLRFRQVLFNLLSNAIKFTPAEGTVTLSIRDEVDDDNNDDGGGSEPSIRVEVRDTGIGISETAMKNLFKHFSQGGTCVSRQYGGSGLGLAICKHLVEAMKGQIGCSSEGKNKGSTFWFTLPLPVGSSIEEPPDSTQVAACSLAGSVPPSPPDQEVPTASAQHHHQARHCFDGMKVLLVEDNVVNQKVGRRLLERIGCDVRVAENGQECIDMLERESFSLIFMDCQMPVLDGYEATRRIREKERVEQRSRTPIVALTASCIKSDRQVCFDSGMDDWMSKPFDQGALCSALLKWARQPHSQAER